MNTPDLKEVTPLKYIHHREHRELELFRNFLMKLLTN